MSKSLRCMYTAAGLVFVGVTAWLWLRGNCPWDSHPPYRVAAIVILKSWASSLSRFWRARIRLEDDEEPTTAMTAARRFPHGRAGAGVHPRQAHGICFRDGHSRCGVSLTGQESFLCGDAHLRHPVAGPGAQIHQ